MIPAVSSELPLPKEKTAVLPLPVEGECLELVFGFEKRSRASFLKMTFGGGRPVIFSPDWKNENLRCGTFGNFSWNGIAMRNFSWPEELRRLSEHLTEQHRTDPGSCPFILSLERAAGTFMLRLNGIHLTDFPTLNEWKIIGRDGAKLNALRRVRRLEATSEYLQLDLRHRLNGKEIDGEIPEVADSGVMVGKIPFRLSAGGKFNHLNVGVSLVREGLLSGVYPGSRGPFGGRWGGAFTHNPARLQFRIPNRPWKALHLLALSDRSPDSVPFVTLQFYKPNAGFPKNFRSPAIPRSTPGKDAVAVGTGSGGKLYFRRITIPIDPGELGEFSGLKMLEMELTKLVRPYRAYPDPSYYSFHGAGLPSSVRILAATLEAETLEYRLSPVRYAGIFMEDESVQFDLRLSNRSGGTQTETFRLESRSLDGGETHTAASTVQVGPHKNQKVCFLLPLEKFGHHEIVLTSSRGKITASAVRLRNRGDRQKNFSPDDPGHFFGFWPSGSHETPEPDKAALLMGKAGAKTYVGNLHAAKIPNAANMTAARRSRLESVMAQYGMKSFLAFGFIDFRFFGFDFPRPGFRVRFDPEKPKEMNEAIRQWAEKNYQGDSPAVEPRLVRVFGEPGGIGTDGIPPEYYGKKPREMTEKEAQRFDLYCRKLQVSARMLRKNYPQLKILMPHGEPGFAVPFLKRKELADCFDGVALDFGCFDRLPEMQLGQNAMHRTWILLNEWKKYRKKNGYFATFEGPAFGPVTVGCLTARESMAYLLRAALLLSGYGVTHQYTVSTVFAPASWYGEQHYAGALFGRDHLPYPAYAAFAAMTRHLNGKKPPAICDAPDCSSFCYRYDVPGGRFLYVPWCIRGTRTAVLDQPAEVHDAMDNRRTLAAGETLTVSDLPCWVYCPADTKIVWGGQNHPDSVLNEPNHLLGNLGDGSWKQQDCTEKLYLENNPENSRRIPERMNLSTSDGRLHIRLAEQAEDHGLAAVCTELVPAEPLVIPGRGNRLVLETEGCGDWSRVVYVLRDSAGRKFVSSGTPKSYNCDDTGNRSVLCYSGKRLLKFELPSFAPYDHYRENGMTWWGSDSEAAVAVLPLRLEKVIVERRRQVMYGNGPRKVPSLPISLGKIWVEYENGDETGEAAVRRDQLKLQVPANALAPDPLAELRKSAVLPPLEIWKVEQPSTHYDGTRGVFYFDEMPEAKYYEIYLSLSPDGKGAICCGRRLPKSGSQVRGFLPERDFYAFLIAYDKKGRHSIPSKPFRFKMSDNFGMK